MEFDVERPGFIWDEEYFKVAEKCIYTKEDCSLINHCHNCEIPSNY